jgi:hypothetical protein
MNKHDIDNLSHEAAIKLLHAIYDRILPSKYESAVSGDVVDLYEDAVTKEDK